MSKPDNRTVMEKTTVPQNTVAAIYQQKLLYYFLLELEEDEVAGYEIKDDIHIDYEKTKSTRLIQVKHTILTDKGGEPKNLTQKDVDLWHTIDNWISVISDENDQRISNDKQIEFINSTEFELFTNKISLSNSVLAKINEFKHDDISITDFRKFLELLIKPTKKNTQPTLFDSIEKEDNKLSQTDLHIRKLLSQTDDWLSAFLKKITIHSISDLYEKINDRLKVLMVFNPSDNTVENVYSALHSELTELIEQKGFKKKIVFTYYEFRNILSKCIKRFIDNSRKYEVRASDYTEIPDDIVNNPQKQTFIKQLFSVEDIDENDKQKMLDYTSFRFAAQVSEKRYFNDEALLDDKKEFERTKMTIWDNSFTKIHKKRLIKKLDELTEDEREEKIIELGHDCLSDIREKSLSVNHSNLNRHIVDGHFYWLSDIPEIGWRLDWEKFKSK